jgi:NO-binding membrane sensor protein with MHYT domain
VPDLTYDGNSFWVFVLLTVILGGGAAALAGRAVAATWRPWWRVIPIALLLGAAVRFLHFALFEGTLLSLPYYVADTTVCLACALIGFRVKRVSQMVTSYGWINERENLYRWRPRSAASGRAGTSESG